LLGFSRFGSVFPGLAWFWLNFFCLARFFSGFFLFGFGSVQFFGFRLIKPNQTGRFFQNFNWFFFTVRFFQLFFSSFIGLISFLVFFLIPTQETQKAEKQINFFSISLAYFAIYILKNKLNKQWLRKIYIFFLMFTCNKLAEIFFQSTKKNIFILIYILFEIKSFLLNYFIIDIIILTLHTVIYNIILQLNIHARVCIYIHVCMYFYDFFLFYLLY